MARFKMRPIDNMISPAFTARSRQWSPTRRELCVGAAAGIASLLTYDARADVHTAGDLVAVRADLLYTVSGPPIKNGIVLLNGGKIAAVGAGVEIPKGATSLHAAAVMPAMVDPHSYLGCYYENTEPVDAITPDFRIADGFDPTDPMIGRTVQAGITTVAIMPGNGSVLGGQAAILRLGGAADIIARTAGQKISAGADAANAERNPTSPAGAIALLRAALLGAQNGRAVSSTGQTYTLAGYPTSLSERVEALRALLEGRSRAYFHTPTADDIENVLSVIDSFRLKAALVHAGEGYVLADRVAVHKLPVILGPLGFGDSDHRLSNAARLSAAGIRVAFCTDSPLSPPESLRMSAHIAAHYGLGRASALRAITLSGAEIIGVSSQVGSIEVGKEGDILLLSGDPLDLSSRIEGVVMRGRLQQSAGDNA
jgi:imidazolonepropionase-like amidohydrolase